MAIKTMPRKARSERIQLREDVAFTSAGVAVDRDGGIVKNLKMCGLTSKRGREYPLKVLAEAVQSGLYEGIPCNINHQKPGDDGDANDRLGVWVNTRMGPDGVYGDLQYLKSHPFADRLCEAAERMPNVLGFSHLAEGDSEFRNGIKVVQRINEVYSCDLVKQGATTKSMTESAPVKTNLKQLLESRLPKWSANRQKWAKLLTEDDGMPGMAAEVDAPPDDATADPDEMLWSGFTAAIGAILDKYKAGELDAGTAAKAVGKYVKAHEKLSGGAEPDEPKEDEPEVPDDKKDDEKDKDEKKKYDEQIAKLTDTNGTLREELDVLKLGQETGIVFNDLQTEALRGMKDAGKRKLLAESFKGNGVARGVRSSAPLATTEGKTTEKPNPSRWKS